MVRAVEQADSLEAACSDLRLDIELAGVLRWVRRRVQAVYASLILLKGLLPEWFQGCELTLGAFGQRLGLSGVLPALRPIAAPYLSSLPAPLGFAPLKRRGSEPGSLDQHRGGPDPPACLA